MFADFIGMRLTEKAPIGKIMEGKIIGNRQWVQSDQVAECCWVHGHGCGAGKSK